MVWFPTKMHLRLFIHTIRRVLSHKLSSPRKSARVLVSPCLCMLSMCDPLRRRQPESTTRSSTPRTAASPSCGAAAAIDFSMRPLKSACSQRTGRSGVWTSHLFCYLCPKFGRKTGFDSMAKAKAATASKKKPGRPPAVAAVSSPAKKKTVTPPKEVEKAAPKVINTSTSWRTVA